jgi:peptidoglycan/xylan/chitin deacetylase (PgdA/CDA1 family)
VKGLTIVNYHSLDESGSPISVSPAMFAAHAGWLAKRKFCSLTLTDALARQRFGTLPPKAIVLTFDDGFLNTATVGLPILNAFGLNATAFLVSDHMGGHNDFPMQPSSVPRLPLMDWTAARELQESGWEVGAHTCTHPDLTRVPREQLQSELRDCQAAIEQRLGSPVRAFAYPYGRHGPRERDQAGRNYEAAVSTKLGLASRSSNPYALERVDAYYLSRPNLVRFIGGPLFPAYLTLRQVVRNMRGIT